MQPIKTRIQCLPDDYFCRWNEVFQADSVQEQISRLLMSAVNTPRVAVFEYLLQFLKRRSNRDFR